VRPLAYRRLFRPQSWNETIGTFFLIFAEPRARAKVSPSNIASPFAGLYVGGYRKTIWAFIGKLRSDEGGQRAGGFAANVGGQAGEDGEEEAGRFVAWKGRRKFPNLTQRCFPFH